MNTAPLQAPNCPLCGQPNACAAVAAGTFDTPCWCQSMLFPDALLGSVPAELRQQACICRTCAELHHGHPTEQASQG